MGPSMSQMLEQLRAVPVAVLQRLLDENALEYKLLRARKVPADAPEFEQNCTRFLIYEKALAEHGIRLDAA